MKLAYTLIPRVVIFQLLGYPKFFISQPFFSQRVVFCRFANIKIADIMRFRLGRT